MKKMNKKGFTIVELVIVIAVIAILAAVLIPTFSGIVTKANKSAVLQEARNCYTEMYAEDISDGVADGLKNADAQKPVTKPTTYTTDSNPTYDPDATESDKFVYTKNSITVKLTKDGKWE